MALGLLLIHRIKNLLDRRIGQTLVSPPAEPGAYLYELLTAAGLTPIMPLEDHPWGDRGFAVQDPNGVVLYIYAEREPSPEFKQYYKA